MYEIKLELDKAPLQGKNLIYGCAPEMSGMAMTGKNERMQVTAAQHIRFKTAKRSETEAANISTAARDCSVNRVAITAIDHDESRIQ